MSKASIPMDKTVQTAFVKIKLERNRGITLVTKGWMFRAAIGKQHPQWPSFNNGQ